MAYTKTVWKNGQTPALDEDNLNKIEQGIYDNDVGKIPKITSPTSGNFPVINSDGTLSDSGISAVGASVGVVRYDVAQMLSITQQQQALTNVGAANVDTQTKVFAASVGYEAVTISAENLISYLNALPKMLTKNYTISVNSGTISETINLRGFFGSGSLDILCADNTVAQAGVFCNECTVSILIKGCSISGIGRSAYSATVYCGKHTNIMLADCDIVGDGTNTGIYADSNSNLCMNRGSLSNCKMAVNCFSGTFAKFESVSCSNNTTGVDPYGGGVVIVSGNTDAKFGSSAAYTNTSGLVFNCVGGLATNFGGTGTNSVGGIAYSTVGFRGSKLATADTNPGVNNTICWTYY